MEATFSQIFLIPLLIPLQLVGIEVDVTVRIERSGIVVEHEQ